MDQSFPSPTPGLSPDTADPAERIHLPPRQNESPALCLIETPAGFMPVHDSEAIATARAALDGQASDAFARECPAAAFQGRIAIGPRAYRYQSNRTPAGWHHALRLIGKAAPDPAALSLPAHILTHLSGPRRPGLSGPRRHGLILVAGSAGSGKTTTVSALYGQALRQDSLIGHTIEDPPEYNLSTGDLASGQPTSWSTQTEPPGGEWAQGIAAAQRSDAAIILIGEIRDPACAAAAISAAIAGPLVLSTIHGANIDDAIERLVLYAASRLGTDLARDQVSRCLLAVIHQNRVHRMGPGSIAFTGILAASDLETAIRSKIRTGTSLQDEIRAQPRRMATR